MEIYNDRMGHLTNNGVSSDTQTSIYVNTLTFLL